MKAGPEQSQELPKEFDHFDNWWMDREEKIDGEVVVKASLFPPVLKEIILKGLRDKDLTWAFLFSDNFMPMACYSYVPLDDLCIFLELVAIPAEIKPSLQGFIEMLTEHWWRVRGVPGQLDYDRRIFTLLRKVKITLPFKYEGMYIDELRLYTHNPPTCTCYQCLKRPLLEDLKGEAWEVLRKRVAKHGLFVMSWAAKKELEQKLFDEHLWDIDTSIAGEIERWTYAPDDRKEIKYLRKAELTEVARRIDGITKQQRLPTHEEMDWVMKKIGTTKEEYLIAEKLAEAKRVKAAKAAGSGEKADSASASASASGCTSMAASSSDTRDSASTSASVSTAQSRGRKSRSSRSNEEEEEECVTKMSAVELDDHNTEGQSSKQSGKKSDKRAGGRGGEESGEASGDEGGGGLAASRPRRSAAQKVKSYVDVEASSDEEGGRRGRKHSADRRESSEEEVSDGSSVHWSGSEGGGGGGGGSGESSDIATSDEEGEGGEGGERVAKPSRARTKSSGGQKKARTPRAEGDSSGGMFGKLVWNDEMDARLVEAVGKFGRDWVSVAAHVGGGVDRTQCRKRFITKVDPALQGLNNGPWTDEEFELLKSLVEQHATTGLRGGIDWAPVGRELGRNNDTCNTKWKNSQKLLRAKSQKKGPYSPGEDAIILARVVAWDMNKQGLWSGLETELGRGGDKIQQRWTCTLSKR